MISLARVQRGPFRGRALREHGIILATSTSFSAPCYSDVRRPWTKAYLVSSAVVWRSSCVMSCDL